MGGEITIHNRATSSNTATDGQEFTTKANQNVRITGDKIDTSVNNGKVYNAGNNRTMELSNYKYKLIELIAGMDGNKQTFTEEDFIKFKAKYLSDEKFRNKVQKECKVTGVKQDANAGVTTINFSALDIEYNRVNSTIRVDFETATEKKQIELKEKTANENTQAKTQAQTHLPQKKEESFIDKFISFFK